MRRIYILAFSIIGVLLFSFFSSNEKKPGPAVVTVKKNGNVYTLLRNGEPYYIKGAGGYDNYERLKQCGGNSVRIWTTKNAKEYLDKAQSLGLTVTLGLDMALERHGFNYDDKKAVKEQFEELKKDILALKDHPALLLWGVGNEVDQFANNFNVWDAVNDLAKFIHQVDPNHPTTTMLAGVPPKHVQEIVKRCSNIDILSINSFTDLPYIKNKITDAGWTGPYLIGEWGASGYWETPTTPWGAFIEETSSQKANVCEERYTKAILSNTERCLGSYIFYWGFKQARTHTLLSLFMESGEEIEVIDILQKHWNGMDPLNTSPQITPINIENRSIKKGIYLKPLSYHTALTDAIDAEMDSLRYVWEIYHESTEKKEGGDKENKPSKIDGLILAATGKQISFKTPGEPGAYRLYVAIFDGKNHAATANVPFYVKR